MCHGRCSPRNLPYTSPQGPSTGIRIASGSRVTSLCTCNLQLPGPQDLLRGGKWQILSWPHPFRATWKARPQWAWSVVDGVLGSLWWAFGQDQLWGERWAYAACRVCIRTPTHRGVPQQGCLGSNHSPSKLSTAAVVITGGCDRTIDRPP